jgi:hypothetical protein
VLGLSAYLPDKEDRTVTTIVDVYKELKRLEPLLPPVECTIIDVGAFDASTGSFVGLRSKTGFLAVRGG